jgi:uncharacterized damage-inducible protein DinB
VRKAEFWLRGSVEGVPPLLMPVAHALLQSREDLRQAAEALPPAEVWHRPGGAASVGFHLRHIGGSLDRLFTYVRGRSLDADQLAAVREEASPGTPPATAKELLAFVDAAMDEALGSLRDVPEEELLTPRAVGRARLPSNLLGLVFHAAEHTQRHTGQVITTSKIIRGLGPQLIHPTNKGV